LPITPWVSSSGPPGVVRQPGRAIPPLAQGFARDGANVKSAVIHRLRRQMAALVRGRIHVRARAVVESMVNPTDALIASVAACDHDSLGAGKRVAAQLVADHIPFVVVRRLAPCWCGSKVQLQRRRPHELSWLGTYDYLRDMFDLRPRPRLCAACGNWRRAWAGCNRMNAPVGLRTPNLLRGDTRDRLHDANGPALRFRDGWSSVGLKRRRGSALGDRTAGGDHPGVDRR